ncbi:MAG: hypothetical protein ABI356_13260 [Steroidobacteraceae bacterium]
MGAPELVTRSLADWLHLSGLLAMVVTGLVIGNQARAHAMADNTRERLDLFWELIDSIPNSVLFVLIHCAMETRAMSSCR